MGRIVAIGMSNTDLVCRATRLPRPGETVAGGSFATFAGGKGANQAVAAARAGARVAFGGAVGDDIYGASRVADLRSAGVDVSLIQTKSGVPSGVAMIVVDELGENQIVTAAGANDEVDGNELARRLNNDSYNVALLTWELPAQTSRVILDGLHGDKPIVLNIAPFSLSARDLFPDERVIIVCNTGEASELLGHDVADEEAQHAAQEIRALGCKAAIITLGATGVVGADRCESWAIAAPEVATIDTTGAGDAFCGTLAVWLADGSDLRDAAYAGAAAGACSVTRSGAQSSLPGRDEILTMMERISTDTR